MSEESTERLAEKVAELRQEIDRLEILTKGMEKATNEMMAKMVTAGFVRAVVSAPLLALVVYVAARLALRRRK